MAGEGERGRCEGLFAECPNEGCGAIIFVAYRLGDDLATTFCGKCHKPAYQASPEEDADE